jgi:hypothetical protein
VFAAQNRNQREDWNRGDILEQQDRESQPAVRAGQLLALGQELQIDRRRRQRKPEPDDQSGFPVEAQSECAAADQCSRRDNLHAAGAEHTAPHDPQALR